MNKVNVFTTGSYRLELGCGNKRHWRKDCNLRLDKIDFGQDIVWDLLNGIPLPDNFCSHIYCSHTLEHLPQDRIIDVMNECWRVLKSNGDLWIVVPHMSQERAYIPVHLTQFNISTFEFFTGNSNPDYKDLSEGVGIKVKMWHKFELVKNERSDIHFRATPKGK